MSLVIPFVIRSLTSYRCHAIKLTVKLQKKKKKKGTEMAEFYLAFCKTNGSESIIGKCHLAARP